MTNNDPGDPEFGELIGQLGLPRHDDSSMTSSELDRASETLERVLASPKTGREPLSNRRSSIPKTLVAVIAAVIAVPLLIPAISLMWDRAFPADLAGDKSHTSLTFAVPERSTPEVLESLLAKARLDTAQPSSDSTEVTTWTTSNGVPRVITLQLETTAHVQPAGSAWRETPGGFLVPRESEIPKNLNTESSPSEPAIPDELPDIPTTVRAYLTTAADCEVKTAACLLTGVEVFHLRQVLPQRAHLLVWETLSENDEGLTYKGVTTDWLGREVIGISARDGNTEIIALFDPDTGRFIGRETLEDGQVPESLAITTSPLGKVNYP